jgi:TldD protein
MIRRGEPAELVRGVVVSGNILETLMNVELVARDLMITTSVFGGCGKDGQMVRVGDGGPHIRVSRIVVGGG